MSDATYRNLRRRKQLKVVRRGCKGTPALVDFKSLPTKYQAQIIEKEGDPSDLLKTNSLNNYLTRDTKAFEFFYNYKLANGQHLPEKKVEEYTINASILKSIETIKGDSGLTSKMLGGKKKHSLFWPTITEVVSKLSTRDWPHTLPSKVVPLRRRFNKFIKEGYESLIHGGHGNRNSEKLIEEAKLWVLARWASKVDRVTSSEHLLRLYLVKAQEEGWPIIKSEDTLSLYLNETESIWYGSRYGELRAKKKFGAQIRTQMPTMRDSLWYSDGTKLNLYYKYYCETDKKLKTGTLDVYEVMDAYSEVFLGYAIGKENHQTQFKAFKMALQFSGNKPFELRYDGQGGHNAKDAKNFLDKIAKHNIFTEPYNPQSKTIESAFGRFQKQFMKQAWNFTGQNIQSKAIESKADMEFILANIKNLPNKQECIEQYVEMRNQWNLAPHHKTKVSRMEMYRSSENFEAEKLTIETMIDLFWLLREKPVTVRNHGIKFKKQGIEYFYYVMDEYGNPDQLWLAENVGKKYYIKYDPEDMEFVQLLALDSQGFRLVEYAQEQVVVHRGKQEQQPGDMSYINLVRSGRREIRRLMNDTIQSVLHEHGMHPDQNGLNHPKVAGIETSKRKKNKSKESIGQIMKEESNHVPEPAQGDNPSGSHWNIY